jgi:hypothetical protein
MDRVLQALLRNELRFFFRKVFATVYPGEIYLHNWHAVAIAHDARAGEPEVGDFHRSHWGRSCVWDHRPRQSGQQHRSL